VGYVVLSCILSLLATLLAVVALAINVATLIMLRNQSQASFDSEINQVSPGLSIWLNVATFILMLVVTVGLFCGSRERRDKTRRITIIEDSGKTPITIK